MYLSGCSGGSVINTNKPTLEKIFVMWCSLKFQMVNLRMVSLTAQSLSISTCLGAVPSSDILLKISYALSESSVSSTERKSFSRCGNMVDTHERDLSNRLIRAAKPLANNTR